MQSKITFTDKITLPDGNVYVLTDSNVARLYPFVTERRGYVVPAGEDSKRLEVLADISRDMLAKGCNRQTTMVTVGGGVVGDLGGFTAACYMRGIRWINIPTTLLAQVDSSVGGKTAVDLDGYKNVIGSFYLPEEVILANFWLQTLPPRELVCGEGEIFKTSLLDRSVYDLYKPGVVTPELIRACVAFKERVVAQDFKETGLRKVLNVGHTIGHALEKEDNHRLSHGAYVIMGIALESYLFREMIDSEFYKYMQSTAAALAPVIPFNADKIAAAARTDKKNADADVSVIVTVGLGEYREMRISPERLAEGLKTWT